MFVLRDVTEIPYRAPIEIARMDTPSEVHGFVDVCYMEEDAEHPKHFDIFAQDGRLYTLEPVKG